MFTPAPTTLNVGMRGGLKRDADLAERHRELIVRISEYQDKAAFEELFNWYAPRVKAMLLKQSGSTEVAEDIMQDVFLNVWLKAGQFSASQGSVGAWIFTIARNRRIDIFRKQSSRHYLDIKDVELADDTPAGDDVLLSQERDLLVAEASATLPEEMQEVIRLAFVAEKSQTEIASELGIPLGTVKSRMRRAYEKIKDKLEGAL